MRLDPPAGRGRAGADGAARQSCGRAMGPKGLRQGRCGRGEATGRSVRGGGRAPDAGTAPPRRARRRRRAARTRSPPARVGRPTASALRSWAARAGRARPSAVLRAPVVDAPADAHRRADRGTGEDVRHRLLLHPLLLRPLLGPLPGGPVLGRERAVGVLVEQLRRPGRGAELLHQRHTPPWRQAAAGAGRFPGRSSPPGGAGRLQSGTHVRHRSACRSGRSGSPAPPCSRRRGRPQ